MQRDTTVPNLDERRVWWTIGLIFAAATLDFLLWLAFRDSVVVKGIVIVSEVAAFIWVWRLPQPR